MAGIFVSELRTANYGPLLEAAGCDFAVFDLEHCGFSLGDLSGMFPSFRGLRVQPMVRVPGVKREFIQPVLDLGARGIMVPMVESPEDVRAVLSMMKYPPRGQRGIHFGTPHTGFQGVDRAAYANFADNNILLVIQIETAKGLNNIESILAEPGIDVAFVGNADLASSLGVANDLNGGKLCDEMRRILRTAQKLGIAGGGNFLDAGFAKQFYGDGLRFIMTCDEGTALLSGLRDRMETVRAGLPPEALIPPLPAKSACVC